MDNISLTGIDLAKEVFEIRSENHAGRLVKRQRVGRARLLSVIKELPAGSTIAMEACASAHYWGREFEARGFKVLLIAPQFVTPFRKSQKNDSNDTEAICEAARRPGMRFVGLKSAEQLDLQMLHRIRERLIKQQTALVNQIRGLLLEHGITIPKGVGQFRSKARLLVTELGEQQLFGYTLLHLWAEFCALEKRVAEFTSRIKEEAKQNEACKQISALAGIGPISATAIVASMGKNPEVFRNGRGYAASLGLVPRQFSTGGKTRLGPITKSGDGYIRKLLVHGARTVVRHALAKEKTDALSLWIRALHGRSNTNTAAVALANKTARRLWAILAGKQPQLEPLAHAA